MSLTLVLIVQRRSSIEELNSKQMTKLAKQAGSSCNQGTFAPVWQVLKTSSERLASLHMQMFQKVTELVKDVSKYADELQKKYKVVSSLYFFFSMAYILKTVRLDKKLQKS